MKPIIFRSSEQPYLKSIGFLEKTKNKTQRQLGCGRRSGSSNIKRQVSVERGKSCGDAVSEPISIFCSPARHQPWLQSDFYSSRQATSGRVTHSKGALPLTSCTLIMTRRICACHTLEEGHLSSVKYWLLEAPVDSQMSTRLQLLWGNTSVTLSQLFVLAVLRFLRRTLRAATHPNPNQRWANCQLGGSQPLKYSAKTLH